MDGGTVKLIILDSEYNQASSLLISNVQEVICPNQENTGKGLAPIGHKVTVTTPEKLIINISTEVDYIEGTSIQEIKNGVTAELQNYFLKLRKDWESSSNLTVRIAQIESIILNCENIVDISSTTINGNTSNIQLIDNKIPVIGEVSIT